MAKELYIYSALYDFTAESIVRQLNNVPKDEALTIRLNTPGGNVNAGWATISKLSERKGKITGIIDGQAASMGAIMLLFMDKVIMNDTSEIMFHKAAYPEWVEMTEERKATLKKINEKFHEKLEAKVKDKKGAKAFMDKVFEPDVRNNVSLGSKEALDLGIVDEVRSLEPKAYGFDVQIVALVEDKKVPKSQSNKSNNNNMTLEQFKAENPALYAQIVESAIKKGVEAERDRVGAWLAFMDIDSEAAAKGIKDGENLSQTATAEFTAKGIAKARIGDHAEDNAPGIGQPANGKTDEEIKAEAQKKEADEALGKLGIKA